MGRETEICPLDKRRRNDERTDNLNSEARNFGEVYTGTIRIVTFWFLGPQGGR